VAHSSSFRLEWAVLLVDIKTAVSSLPSHLLCILNSIISSKRYAWISRPEEGVSVMPNVNPKASSDDEVVLAELIAKWSKAVRDEDLAGIRANHDPDMLMFDVPLPLLSRGLDAYMETWQTFYPSQVRPVIFDFEDLEITAGSDVAFATAIGHCVYIESGKKTDLKFRLTMGFKKYDDRWRITHEHHSVPATD
jgi:ketosteroid isomerase-like protein